MTFRVLRRRLACCLGFHRPVGWYVFVRPQHPRYEWRIECLWCERRLSEERA